MVILEMTNRIVNSCHFTFQVSQPTTANSLAGMEAHRHPLVVADMESRVVGVDMEEGLHRAVTDQGVSFQLLSWRICH